MQEIRTTNELFILQKWFCIFGSFIFRMIENLQKSYVSIGTIIKVKSSTKIKLVSDETIAQGCNFRPLQNLRNCFIQHSNISIRVAEPTHLLKFNFGKNMENWSQDLPKVIQTQAMHFHRCHPKDKVKISYRESIWNMLQEKNCPRLSIYHLSKEVLSEIF